MTIKEHRPASEMPDGFGALNFFHREVQILENLAQFNHNHLVALVSSFSRGERHYLLFPWADGGNLREFWLDHSSRPLTGELISEVLQQLTGLIDALCLVHAQQWRHGDLKPENILRFTEDDTRLGTLKISDLGQAKHHQNRTNFRSQPTQTRIGTMAYEAPEAVTSPNEPRSRLYDVWSMGCIFLEFIIWLLDGQDGLKEFTRDVTGQGAYFHVNQDTSEARVHDAVQRRLGYCLQHETWTEGTSLGDLSRVVANRMLVVSLPQAGSFNNDSESHMDCPSPGESVGDLEMELSASAEASFIDISAPSIFSSSLNENFNIRSDAWTLRECMKHILGRAQEDSEYLFPPQATLVEKVDELSMRNERMI